MLAEGSHTLAVWYPYRKKFIGVRSGECGGHSWKPLYMIICSTNSSTRLPSSPCKICTRQGIPNAYHWTQLCPLRQPQFTCDLPITNTTVSQCTGNSVSSSQVTNGSENTTDDRQNSSTEASGPVY
ncbi:hypothetical protein AVEN_263375-1 [Araneus ventricosus]|uniref:Uncharacterized protein n=1 Tax=Araneus ventricosus TaxID=182803 RepID=A0A4Y2D2Z2_ARAVE|nr:hypothetical protein AVEN_263375-1 [Araneus ventricosus]